MLFAYVYSCWIAFFTFQEVFVVTENRVPSAVQIINDKCYVNGTIWGSPCTNLTTNLDLTVNDVLAQKMLLLADDKEEFLAGAFFVPHCNFPKPKESMSENSILKKHRIIQIWHKFNMTKNRTKFSFLKFFFLYFRRSWSLLFLPILQIYERKWIRPYWICGWWSK